MIFHATNLTNFYMENLLLSALHSKNKISYDLCFLFFFLVILKCIGCVVLLLKLNCFVDLLFFLLVVELVWFFIGVLCFDGGWLVELVRGRQMIEILAELLNRLDYLCCLIIGCKFRLFKNCLCELSYREISRFVGKFFDLID